MSTDKVCAERFSVLSVGCVCTGVLLEEGKYGDVRKLMDFFCPGVMTIGAVCAMPNVRDEIYRQHPGLKSIIESMPPPDRDTCETYAEMLTLAMPDGIELQAVEINPEHVTWDLKEAGKRLAGGHPDES